MHVRAFAIKKFSGVIPPDPHSRGKGPPGGVGKGRDGGRREGRAGKGKGKGRGWRSRREEKEMGGEGGKGGRGGGEGKAGDGGKELWRTTFECLPPRLTCWAMTSARRERLHFKTVESLLLRMQSCFVLSSRMSCQAKV
jgi:hypothetical protein